VRLPCRKLHARICAPRGAKKIKKKIKDAAASAIIALFQTLALRVGVKMAAMLAGAGTSPPLLPLFPAALSPAAA